MRTIIAAYSRSREAEDGLRLAAALAALTGRPLEVVEVMARAGALPESERLHRDELEQTRAAVRRVLRDGDVPVTTVGDRSPEHALRKLAGERDVDLLVLGSTHHGPVGRVVLGTAAESVVSHTGCPVAVAPPGFTTLAGPVVAATDGTAASDAAIEFAAGLGDGLRIVTIGHPETVVAAAADRVTAAHPGLAVTTAVLDGDPADTLAGLDGLVVVGRHRHGLARRIALGSVATRLVRHAHAPVIIV